MGRAPRRSRACTCAAWASGEGRGEGAVCGFQAFSPEAGLPQPLLLWLVGVPAGETPGEVEFRIELTGRLLK